MLTLTSSSYSPSHECLVLPHACLVFPFFVLDFSVSQWVGYLLGAVYCVPFTFFMWLQVGCFSLAGRPDSALYSVIPALCCNVFVGWFGYQFYNRMPLRRKGSRPPPPEPRSSVWNTYDHRAIVEGTLLTWALRLTISDFSAPRRLPDVVV